MRRCQRCENGGREQARDMRFGNRRWRLVEVPYLDCREIRARIAAGEFVCNSSPESRDQADLVIAAQRVFGGYDDAGRQ